MELFELYLSPIDETRFTAIVSQSTASGDGGDTPSALPEDGKRRITLIKTLNCLKFSVDDFQGDGELDWMEDKNIITANRDAFHPDYLPQIGNLLYKTLFPPGSPVEKLLGQAIAHAEYNRKSLVLRLKFADDGVQRSRVADYPWELLHDGQRFLCHHSVKLSRYIAYKGVPPKLPPVEKLNVLLVSSEAFSNEIDLKRLSRKEREAIRRGVEKASEDGHICLRELEVSTFEHLRAYLTEHRGEDSPHVVHFDGHGLFGQKCRECGTIHKTTKRQQCRNCGAQLPEPQGYLVFEDEHGDPDYISAKELGTLLQQSGLSDGPSQAGGVVLVVLSACQSGMAVAGESVFNGAAQNLIAHRIPAVVAMQYSVRAGSATKFAEQFYRSLGQKNSLAVAVSQARSAMGVEGNQWYRPVLYLRWEDNDGGQLFAFSSDKFETGQRLKQMEKIKKTLLWLQEKEGRPKNILGIMTTASIFILIGPFLLNIVKAPDFPHGKGSEHISSKPDVTVYNEIEKKLKNGTWNFGPISQYSGDSVNVSFSDNDGDIIFNIYLQGNWLNNSSKIQLNLKSTNISGTTTYQLEGYYTEEFVTDKIDIGPFKLEDTKLLGIWKKRGFSQNFTIE